MHSTIYEFSEQPISESRRATIDSLPEWFFQTVADSAADTDEITRAVQIRCLEQHFGDLCIRDGDQLRFVHDFKARYFRNSYPYFMAAVRALAKASSFSPLMRSTGLRLSTVPMAAAAGVQRPPFFRYLRVSTVI